MIHDFGFVIFTIGSTWIRQIKMAIDFIGGIGLAAYLLITVFTLHDIS